MTTRNWAKRTVLGSALTVVLPLAACSEAQQALDTAGGAVDKAQACGQAIGIVTSFNPESLSPQQIQQQAGKKAGKLQELGNQVADASVRDALFAVADGYVALEQRQAETLNNVNDWVQQNIDKVNSLKRVCL